MEHLITTDEQRREVRKRLLTLQREWEQARNEDMLYQDGGVPHADGLQALRNARCRLNIVGARYREVLREFTEIILRR